MGGGGAALWARAASLLRGAAAGQRVTSCAAVALEAWPISPRGQTRGRCAAQISRCWRGWSRTCWSDKAERRPCTSSAAPPDASRACGCGTAGAAGTVDTSCGVRCSTCRGGRCSPAGERHANGSKGSGGDEGRPVGWTSSSVTSGDDGAPERPRVGAGWPTRGCAKPGRALEEGRAQSVVALCLAWERPLAARVSCIAGAMRGGDPGHLASL